MGDDLKFNAIQKAVNEIKKKILITDLQNEPRFEWNVALSDTIVEWNEVTQADIWNIDIKNIALEIYTQLENELKDTGYRIKRKENGCIIYNSSRMLYKNGIWKDIKINL